jgi:hypothetical protein
VKLSEWDILCYIKFSFGACVETFKKKLWLRSLNQISICCTWKKIAFVECFMKNSWLIKMGEKHFELCNIWLVFHKWFLQIINFLNNFFDWYVFNATHNKSIVGHCTKIFFYGSLYTKTLFMGYYTQMLFLMGHSTQILFVWVTVHRLFYGSLYTKTFLWVTVHKDFFYGSLYTKPFLWVTVHKYFVYGSLYTNTFLWVTVHRYFFMGHCTQILFYGSL